MMTSFVPFKASPEPWKPRDYMKKAVKFLLGQGAAALFLDPGLGKTSITLAAIKLLLKKGLIGKVLVIAPLRVCHLVWPKEAEKWTDFQGLRIVVLHGKNKESLLHEEADIYVINPEGLDWLLGVVKEKYTSKSGKVLTRITPNLKRFKAFGFDLLVIDELSKFKHTGSQRFKALKEVHKLFPRKWGLTGSPAANGLMDLFGQCFILDEGRTFGQFITHYRKNYFDKGYDGFSWELKDGAADKIYKKVKPLALRMAAEDYLEMPAMIENNILLELPTAARKVYDEMERELFTLIDDDIITAANVAVALGKLRQIANGGIYKGQSLLDMIQNPGKTRREVVHLHTVKVDAVEDLLEELQGAPLFLAYDFEHDLERIKRKFGAGIPYIGGGVSTERSKEIEARWNRGEIQLLPAHPQSVAHGLNLQEQAQHVGWHSLMFNYELYDQFNRRVYRQGNKFSRVFLHHFIMEDTVDDQLLLPLMKSKKSDQKSLFDALKSYRKKRK
jgi:hypothetical protein